MAADDVRRCRYCGEVMAETGRLLLSSDKAGNYGFCQASPVRQHEVATILRPFIVPSLSSEDQDELAKRARMRAIADQAARLIPEVAAQTRQVHPGPWTEGTCSRCGTDTLVIGPDVQKLCVYCDELRILPPLPVKRQEPVPPATRSGQNWPAIVLCAVLTIAGAHLLWTPAFPVGVLFLALALTVAKRA